MDRRKFLHGLNAVGLAAYCRTGFSWTPPAAAPSHASPTILAMPRIKVSSESSLGPMLFNHCYLPIPEEDSRARLNLDLSDLIQWKTRDAALWVGYVPGADSATGKGQWIAAHCEGSQLIQTNLNRRVDAFLEGGDALIGKFWLGKFCAMDKWYLEAVARGIRRYGLLGIAMAASPKPFEPRETERNAQLHLDALRSTFDIVFEIDLTTIIACSAKMSRFDTFQAIGDLENRCLATLCAGLARHDASSLDTLRKRLCELKETFAGD